MATKQNLTDLKKAAEDAQKAYAAALEAGRKEAIADIHKIIADNQLPMSALVTKEQALTVAIDLVQTYGLTAAELGLKGGKADKADAPKGGSGEKRMRHFIINGAEVFFGGKTPQADYQVVLDTFKTDKSVKGFFNPEYLKDTTKTLEVIHRLEGLTKHKIKPEQLKEYGQQNRDALEKAGTAYDKRAKAQADAAAKKAAAA